MVMYITFFSPKFSFTNNPAKEIERGSGLNQLLCLRGDFNLDLPGNYGLYKNVLERQEEQQQIMQWSDKRHFRWQARNQELNIKFPRLQR